MTAAVVETNRCLLALADDADNAALGTAHNSAWTHGPCPRGRHAGRHIRAASSARSGAAAPSGLSGLLRPCHCGAGGLRGRERVEVFAGDRVLVFLPEKFLRDKHIDIRGECAHELATEEFDSPCVLPPSENELGLLLTLGHLFPDWHGNGHQDGHDTQGHDQSRHRVAAIVEIAIPSTCTIRREPYYVTGSDESRGRADRMCRLVSGLRNFEQHKSPSLARSHFKQERGGARLTGESIELLASQKVRFPRNPEQNRGSYTGLPRRVVRKAVRCSTNVNPLAEPATRSFSKGETILKRASVRMLTRFGSQTVCLRRHGAMVSKNLRLSAWTLQSHVG